MTAKETSSEGQSADQATGQATGSLNEHRQVILVRSVLVGAAKMLPMPGLSDMLGAALSRGLVYHVAQLRYVDIEDGAVEALTASPDKQGRLNLLSALGGLLSLLRRGRMRRLFAGLAVLNGIEAGMRAFHTALVLDHYCAHHHTGVAIGAEEARRLRQTIDESVRAAQRSLGGAVLDQVIKQTQRFFQTVPPWVWAQLKRADAMPPLPALQALAHEAKKSLGVLSLDRYFNHVVQNFDQRWNKTPA